MRITNQGLLTQWLFFPCHSRFYFRYRGLIYLYIESLTKGNVSVFSHKYGWFGEASVAWVSPSASLPYLSPEPLKLREQSF